MVLFLLLACSPGVSPAPADTAAGSSPALDTGAETGDTAGGDTALPDTGPGETADTAVGDTAAEDIRSKALCAILRLEDANADGSPESGDRSRVDASGNLLLKEYTDGSGLARTRVTYTYDATNALLVEEDDLDGDGVVDVTFTRTYDPQGNELTLVTTGLWDADYSWSYVYDGAGRVLVAEYDGYFDHTDGIVDERDVFTRDAAGNPLLVTQDADMDGAPELSITRAWDADGRVLTEAWDYELLDAWGTPGWRPAVVAGVHPRRRGRSVGDGRVPRLRQRRLSRDVHVRVRRVIHLPTARQIADVQACVCISHRPQPFCAARR